MTIDSFKKWITKYHVELSKFYKKQVDKIDPYVIFNEDELTRLHDELVFIEYVLNSLNKKTINSKINKEIEENECN
jgi:hypothetical protein